MSQAWIDKISHWGIGIAGIIGFILGFILHDVRITFAAVVGTFLVLAVVGYFING